MLVNQKPAKGCIIDHPSSREITKSLEECWCVTAKRFFHCKSTGGREVFGFLEIIG